MSGMVANLGAWAGACVRDLQARQRDHRLRYLSYREQAMAWWRNRRVPSRLIDEADARARRKSDTVFVIGSGPSITRLTADQWRRIGGDDSFGINFAFLLDFVPTFHLMEDPKTLRSTLRETLAPRRAKLSPTVWVMARKQLRRAIHPRCAPELFPESPTVWTFPSPPTIVLDRDRPFVAGDFDRAIVYRGSMSVALYLVLHLGYRRLVLLGVDLQTYGHFYDERPEMRAFVTQGQREHRESVKQSNFAVYPSMVPLGHKYRRFDEYLYALNELWLRPRGIQLFVGNDDNVLCPRIPCFAW